jgi:hypothetical protein
MTDNSFDEVQGSDGCSDRDGRICFGWRTPKMDFENQTLGAWKIAGDKSNSGVGLIFEMEDGEGKTCAAYQNISHIFMAFLSGRTWTQHQKAASRL